MTTWKHDDLQEDLAAHLRGNTDRMVWTNTQLGPAGSARPDVFTIDKSYARFACDAYECKISVSDLRGDVTSGKWTKYLAFAHRVWFAIPAGLVKLDDIPRECGVIVRHDGVWRAARKPIAKSLDTLPRNACLKLLIEAHQPVEFVRVRPASEWLLQQELRKKLGDEAAQLFDDRSRATRRYQAATERLNTESAEMEGRIVKMREVIQQRASQQQAALTSVQLHLARALGMTQADEEITISELIDRLNDVRAALQTRGIDRTIEQLTGLRELIGGKKDAA